MAGGDSARAGTTSIPGPLSVELVEATRPGAPAHRRAGTDDGAGVGRHPLRWPDTCAVLLLVVVGVVLPALLALGAHAFDIPRNDDWAYRRALEGFTRTGHISMAGWGAMTLVGQIFWATPFMLLLGDRSWVPGLAVAVLSGLGLVAAYALARSLLDWGRAVAACLLLLALPGFAPNTSSYMTDVPAFAAEAGCLALGLVALCRSRSSRWAWLAASLAVGAFGFSIREFDLAAPVAVLAVLIVRDRRRLSRYFLAGAPLALACGLTYWWAAHLPGSQHKALGLPSLATLRSMLGAFFTLALFVSPVLPFAWRRQRWPPRRSGVIGAAACLAGGIWLIAGHAPVLIGNYLTRSGAEGAQVLAGYRPGLFPRPFWDVLQGTALGAGTALAFVACNGIRLRRPLSRSPAGESLVKAFFWMSTAGLVAYGLFVRASLFDRYLWPLSFAIALLALARRQAGVGNGVTVGPARHVERAFSAGLAVVIAAVTVSLTLNSDAFDAARWAAGQDAVRLGYKASTVDAGFEWVGAHQLERAVPDHGKENAPPYETWYDEMFPGFNDCAVVAGAPLGASTLALLSVTTYNELFFAVPEHLFIYGAREPGCPSLASAKL